MMNASAEPLRVAIGGLGAIGLQVAEALDRGIDGLALSAVSANDKQRAAARVEAFHQPPAILDLATLADAAEIVVECAPAAVFRDVAAPAVEAGRIFIPLSVGQLLLHEDLIARAPDTGARILVPTGALLGLDAVRAAAEGTIHSVTMVTRKPPMGLKSAPLVIEQGLDLDALAAPLCLFEGSAREAARGFPANINVAVALSLAGIGPDRTRVEIWADPAVTRNTHTIRVDSDATRFEMTIEGIPSPDNPATGLLTPLSVIATLKGLVAPLKVGT